ncbi:MAG: ACT domain-containing protein [Thermodesulfovibrionales bacterium]
MEVPNTPGQAACVLTALADAKVNLLAFSGFPSGRKSQLDFVPEDVALFKRAVKVGKMTVRAQKFGFLVQGRDKKGAVADILGLLAEKKINVTAIDAVSAGAGRFGAILWVKPADVARAARALGAK